MNRIRQRVGKRMDGIQGRINGMVGKRVDRKIGKTMNKREGNEDGIINKTWQD